MYIGRRTHCWQQWEQWEVNHQCLGNTWRCWKWICLRKAEILDRYDWFQAMGIDWPAETIGLDSGNYNVLSCIRGSFCIYHLLREVVGRSSSGSWESVLANASHLLSLWSITAKTWCDSETGHTCQGRSRDASTEFEVLEPITKYTAWWVMRALQVPRYKLERSCYLDENLYLDLRAKKGHPAGVRLRIYSVLYGWIALLFKICHVSGRRSWYQVILEPYLRNYVEFQICQCKGWASLRGWLEETAIPNTRSMMRTVTR